MLFEKYFSKVLNSFNVIFQICIAGAFYPHYFKRSRPYDYERDMAKELNKRDAFSTLVMGGIPDPADAVFYDHQIRSIFTGCSKDLEIIYENTKYVIQFFKNKHKIVFYFCYRAYVQFPKRKFIGPNKFCIEIPGHIPTPMHLALKMKSIHRRRFQVMVYRY